jgi:hypothetical protein
MCRKIRCDGYCANFFGLHGQLNRPYVVLGNIRITHKSQKGEESTKAKGRWKLHGKNIKHKDCLLKLPPPASVAVLCWRKTGESDLVRVETRTQEKRMHTSFLKSESFLSLNRLVKNKKNIFIFIFYIPPVRLSLSVRLISRGTVFFSHSKSATAGL